MQLTAVYSRHLVQAYTFGEPNKAQYFFDSLDDLGSCEHVDAVYIASPNSFHYEQAALLLSHGKHVLCEKPITSNARELEHLIQLAGQNNVILLEAIRSIFTPGDQALAKHRP